MDSFATTVSVALQYGVPLRDLVNKFAHVRFEPSGFTGNQEIPIAKSIVDYIFRWLGSRFLSTDDEGHARPHRPLRDRDDAPVGSPASRSRHGRPRCPPVRRGRRRQRPSRPTQPEPAAPSRPRGRPSPTPTRPRRRPSPRSRSAAAPEELAVIATNGHANGHAANGNGARRQRERRRRVDDHAEPGRHEGQLPDPGRRPQLRRLRLDHGPQRQLLQVPQLREHERLQLM